MINLRQFDPHPLLRGGHAQTLAGVYLPHSCPPHAATAHRVSLPHGEAVILHDDQPTAWQPTGASVLLVHGLGGCHGSNYMRRIASRLFDRGIRVWRLDLLGCGAGADLAAFGAHCGSWRELDPVITRIAELAPESPLAVVGFSMGGGLALNMAAEIGSTRLGNWSALMAISPPIDLLATSDHLMRGWSKTYDKYFTDLLWRSIVARSKANSASPRTDGVMRPRRLRDFDDLFTAPAAGFANAEDYYRQTSVAPRLADIDLPTLIITAEDDPVIPAQSLAQANLGRDTERVITRSGGHLGFVGRTGVDRDRRWIDWRVLEFVALTVASETRLGFTHTSEVSS